MQPLLQVENLTKTFTRKGHAPLPAVRGVSFQLMPGECVGLVGQSGSGKSTTARLIARLLDADAGRIVLDGVDITHARGRALRGVWQQVQMVFQSPADSFDPRCTLGNGIAESLRCRGLPRSAARCKTEELLQKCGLPPEFADRYPHQVSGGQCQRAALARALAVEPKLLICDEVTSALDVTVQQEILALLQTLRKQAGAELTMLFISHDLAAVEQLCDRTITM